ncbi:MAG TPA: hypothetical protein VLA93_09915 [Pyrinomonadaceae bacterium]|nr:hypothetical protein [Pyrinomonadaceae bacterium]
MQFYKPYQEDHVNFIYNLLFCDDLTLWKNENTIEGAGLWPTLLAEKPDLESLKKIANDEANEGRVRALAFHRLRELGQKPPPKKLFGVIVEVPQEQGLDIMAAFSEGGVRYINYSGAMAIFEGSGNPVEKLAKELIASAQPVVDQIGPWDKKRLPPPDVGKVRITMLVSDGLYFGEGPFEGLNRDPLAGPVLHSATRLLQRVVDTPSHS